MKDWLIKRLPPGREQSDVWRELANVLADFWDGQFAPSAQELEDAKSLFSASMRDLVLRQAELGDFFSVEIGLPDESRPLAIAWRLREINHKDAASIIESAVNRVFGNIGARWEPLYNPIARPYTQDNLMSETEYRENGFTDEEMLLTSRGRVWVEDIRLRQGNPHIQKNDFVRLLRSEIDKIRPVHIVYDGEIFTISIEFTHNRLPIYFSAAQRISGLFFQHESLPVTTAEKTREKDTHFEHITALPPAHMAYDELPSDFSPLDLHYY